MKPKILITGATGGLGKTAAEYALLKGAPVMGTGRNRDVLSQLENAGATTYCADLTTLPDTVLKTLVENVTAVWHCAGLVSPWAPLSDYITGNVGIATRMFIAAAQAGVPTFVHISSPAIYFDFSSKIKIPETFVAKSFASPYAKSKALAENELLKLAEEYPKTKLVILRPRLLYGKNDQTLLPHLMQYAKTTKGHIFLPKGGEVVMDLCHLVNAAHGIWLATHADIPSGSIFNLTDGEALAVRVAILRFFAANNQTVKIHNCPYELIAGLAALIEQGARVFNKKPIVTTHSMASLAFHTTLDIQAARQRLGYEPLVSIFTSDLALNGPTSTWVSGHG